MKTNNTFRKEILSSPGYWVEAINGILYEAILNFMKSRKMKRKDLAEHLGISPGRVSQILNDGEINFSIEKLVEISLKLGKVPLLKLIDIAEVDALGASNQSPKPYPNPNSYPLHEASEPES